MKKTSFAKILLAALAFSTLALSGCATHPGSGPSAEVYEVAQAHRQVSVERGVIKQVKRVTIKGTNTAAVAGGGLGGVAATYLSRNANNYAKAVVASLGALGGTLIGAEVSSSLGWQLIVVKENKQIVAITLASSESFIIGQRVILTGDGRVLAEN